MEVIRDSAGCCSHLKALLSVPNLGIPNKSIQSLIGKLNTMPTEHFLAFVKDMNYIFMKLITREPKSIDYSKLMAMNIKNNDGSYCLWDSRTEKFFCPNYVISDPTIRALMKLPSELDSTTRTWCGLLKLKTALIHKGKYSLVDMMDSINTITRPFGGDYDEYHQKIRPIFRSITRNFCRFLKNKDPNVTEIKWECLPMVLYPPNEKSSFLMSSNPKIGSTAKNWSERHWNLKLFLHHPLIRSLYESNPSEFTSRLLIGAHCKSEIHPYYLQGELLKADHPLCMIQGIPEPGLKIRTICIPTLAYQSISFGLWRVLDRSCDLWQSQGVGNHQKAQQKMSNLLKAKPELVIHGLDYSNFTDRFPFFLQRDMLEVFCEENLITEFQLRLFETIVQSPVLGYGIVFKYGCGTQMGIYPSFPAASLAHGLLIATALTIAYGKFTNDLKWDRLPFLVTGDDAGIWDNKTFQVFGQILEVLDMPLNPDKIISSKGVTQFCSHVITASGIYEQRKVKPFLYNSLEDAVEKVKFYGYPVALDYIPEVQRDIERLKLVLEPVGFKSNTCSTPYEVLRIEEKCLLKDLRIPLSRSAKDLKLLQKKKDILPKFDVLESPVTKQDLVSQLINSQSYIELCHELDLIKNQLREPGIALDDQRCITLCNNLILLHNRLDSLVLSSGLQREDLVHRDYSRPIRAKDFSELPNRVRSELNQECESLKPGEVRETQSILLRRTRTILDGDPVIDTWKNPSKGVRP